MPSRRFDQAKPFVTLGIIVVAWLVIPVAVKSFLRASFFELQAPISTSASYARDLQEYWSLRLHTKRELITAGRDLARVNASYDLAVQQNSALQAEVGRLQQLLNMPPMPDYRFVHARVVRRDFSAWWQRLVIRQGRDAGIPIGAAVVYGGGVVGRVAQTGAYNSVVDLISSPSVRLAATIAGDTRPISYQGGVNPVIGPAQGYVEYVPLDVIATPAAPLRLTTSGLGGVFPPGLTIGEVVRVEPSPGGLFLTGTVRLSPRLEDLTEVTVLVPVANQP